MTSINTVQDEEMVNAPPNLPAGDGKGRYKSWKSEQSYSPCLSGTNADRRDRKKYRKMRLAFEQNMRESDSLFKAEQKATETIRRLCEDKE